MLDLPRCCAAEITITHPIGPLVLGPVLGWVPQPDDHPLRDQVLDVFLFRLRVMLDRKPEILYASATALVFGLTPWAVLKISDRPDSEDICNMAYITANVPEVPVPAILGAFRGAGRHWVFMARVPGERLNTIWTKLTPMQKLSVQGQLNTAFAALARYERPPQGPCSRLGSVAAGICRDALRKSRASLGSIPTEMVFNDFLCDTLDPRVKRWLRHIRAGMRNDHRIVLTHGNLHPRNILVKVTAILGWERAGWYPDYWDYVRAMSATEGPLNNALDDWIDFLPTELRAWFQRRDVTLEARSRWR
ncbi:phosphotransferase enzyme family protein [Hirsutella rhossiliensis]|uniref:Phosphotransferase enzyme family domain-containing protein n=1 Tax=Hirsutella rhossiliensis TaxID=111463 RepID=A0A9P8N5L9_9HYPO|nr:phosphotransferase enzyme family domain-containing protein [Hirsutella rhossiliensis]KAH0967397.1 phosphotransferase enzyme family domain-containing protein [Hirsutella rhossiliensis]